MILSGARLLLIEDDDSLREILAMNLADHGLIVDQAPDGAQGLALYDPSRHDLVLTDLKMPGLDGFELLNAIHKRDPQAVVLILTAFGGSTRALEAMRHGAFHYVEKPVNTKALIAELARAFDHRRATRSKSHAFKEEKASMVAASPAMNHVLRIVDKVAGSEAPVMIFGESGVGKELVARAIHMRSLRAKAPFIAINCAAIPAELLESTLFGHEAGAFTGADVRRDGKFLVARGGTLFLDEIAEMSPSLQSKLLRVLQDKHVERLGSNRAERVDVRILTATHQDLRARISEGLFRRDLYYRLHVIPLEVPPLRRRREDIPVLTRHFLRQLAPGVSLDREVDEALMSYAWPGNVRELRNVVERMVLLRDTEMLTREDLPPELCGESISAQPISLPDEGFDLIAHEIAIIKAALLKMGGNRSATARFLKLPRHVLIYRLDKYGLVPNGTGPLNRGDTT